MSAATINYLQSSGEWNFLLSNKMVFISGGGGYISQSIACTCYLHGAKFVLADINKQGALDVKQQILKQDNKFDVNSDDDDDRMLVIEVDVADENSVKQAVGLAMSKWNKINILINTTAIFPMGTVEVITDDVWNHVLAINIKGYALMAKLIVPIMKQQQETCTIINFASASGMIAIPKSVPYPTTKAAIIQMSKNMSLDLGTYNIRVISISPGPIESPTLNNIAQIRNNIPQDNVSEIFATKCSKRLGQAQEIANMVVFLISDLCCFCTGTNIIVDGGMTI